MEKQIYSIHFDIQNIVSLITESQNSEIWNAPLESTWSNIPAQPGPQEPVAQHHL